MVNSPNSAIPSQLVVLNPIFISVKMVKMKTYRFLLVFDSHIKSRQSLILLLILLASLIQTNLELISTPYISEQHDSILTQHFSQLQVLVLFSVYTHNNK